MSHLFEPFFTTKKAGEGYGVGPGNRIRDCQANAAERSGYTANRARGTNFRITCPGSKR